MNLDALTACAGNWRGTSTLQDSHAGIAEESPSATTDLSGAVVAQPRVDVRDCRSGLRGLTPASVVG